MSEDELVVIVDADNNEIDAVTRREMRVAGLIHRAAYILVFNPGGEIFVQKRTQNKDVYPGYYDVAAGGVVLAGESYQASAGRELKEELGVEGIPLIPHFDFFHEHGQNRVWGRVFSCVYEGPMILQAEEVEDGFFCDPKAVFDLASRESFTPDGILVLKKYLTLDLSSD
jgi:8-oxo-dGTP pyrophosphatase MutT (NUDIX family)